MDLDRKQLETIDSDAIGWRTTLLFKEKTECT